MPMITSKDNQYLKLIRAIQSAKGRRTHGLFLAEGLRLSCEALQFGDCAFVLLSEDLMEAAHAQTLHHLLQQSNAPVFTVDRDLLQSAAATEHAQGVLTAVRLPVPQRPVDSTSWYVYADAIADPGNLGTIWRSAHATGAGALLLSSDSVDPFNPKVVRASMGAAFKLPVYRCQDNIDALGLMEKLGLARLCARASGMDIRDCGRYLLQPHVWILGAEAAGISDFWLQHETLGVSLPMQANAESLNVASAAAVLFYQSFFVRNRR